ncbi:uncharacterized protein LTR77_005081 [Saxophila tyrrhenica]|uniref:Nucleoporin n=1 Tax=Saxophila tyrrhenica TaxID=1690608 RepID=A0AAV9PF00_9PEZI|nr:hypothetical protein LTR77_005081 [Saxophila tyrrhenica]
MASPTQSNYFPPLDKCLAGSERLVSWRTASTALCDPRAATNNALQAFLSDPESNKYLTHALDPFPKPGPRTKNDFETKTAPIHVAQSTNGDYDLEELKKDAQWLSEQVAVEELVALRCVVLEWQQRAEEQLLASLGENGSAVGGTELGASLLGTSTAGFASSLLGPTTTDEFTKEEPRRTRQLQLYLEEREHIRKVEVALINRTASSVGISQSSGSWIDDLGAKVVEDMCSPNSRTAFETFLSGCIKDLEKSVELLDDSTKWPKIFLADEAKQGMYAVAGFRDLTSGLQLLLAALHLITSNTYIPGGDLVRTYFELMGKVSFFSATASSPALPDPSALKALASLVSVSILYLPAAVSNIQDTASQMLNSGSVQYPALPTQTDMYINDETCLHQVNLVIFKAATSKQPLPLAGPAILAWSLLTSNIRDIAKLLQQAREQRQAEEANQSSPGMARRPSRDDLSTFENQFARLQDGLNLEEEDRDDPPGCLARVAVDGIGVFDILSQLASTSAMIWDDETSFIARAALFDLLRESTALVSYSADLLDAVLSSLVPNSKPATKMESKAEDLNTLLADRLLESDDMQRAILSQAVARYPFELSPLLRLLTALTAGSNKQSVGPVDLVRMLDVMPSLTIMVDHWFKGYQLENEDENENNIALTEDLPLFISKQFEQGFFPGNSPKAITMGNNGSHASTSVLTIPAGTQGLVIKETRPMVLRLEHQHSALEYLGLLLATSLPASELLPAPPMDTSLDRATTADIISLTTAILTASLRQHKGVEEARYVLGRLSNSLPEGQDIILIIFDILETELLAHLDQSTGEGSLDLLVACAECTATLVPISPDRVWSSLNRSALLGLIGGANALAAVVGGSEVPSGSFRFLAASVDLYASLVDDAVAGLVKRKPRFVKSRGRFDSPMTDQDATPERSIGAVLVAFQRAMGDAWMGVGEWRFGLREERCGIWTNLAGGFETLLRAAYGVGGEGQGISGALEPAARLVVEAFAGQDGTLQSFTRVFGEGLGAQEPALTPLETKAVVGQIAAAAEFLATLLRTTKMLDVGHDKKRGEVLGRQLVKLMPNFAALVATGHAYKQCLSLLLAEVVQAVNGSTSTGSTDTPSLLSPLSADAGRHFLAVVSHLDRPLRDLEVETSIWAFLAAVMANKQQWFAVYLLTGSLPRDRLKAQSAPQSKKSLLTYALDQLSDIAATQPERAIAMLKFVAAAQNAWVWASSQIREHETFLKTSIDWLSNLQPPSEQAKKGNTAEQLLAASEHRTAAYLCEILAVGVHAGCEVGDRTVLKLSLPKLRFLREHGSEVDAYNNSLHGNLEKNFKKKYEDVSIEVTDFKRTTAFASPTHTEKGFEYDLEFAEQVLGHELAWLGARLSVRDTGFKEEFSRANVNLNLMHAQRELLSAWRILATTMSECLDTGSEQEQKTLGEELAKVVERCLRANANFDLGVPGMGEVVDTRMGLAFTVLSKLAGLRVENDNMRGLLAAAYDAVVACPVNYDVAEKQEELVYWRTVLQVLYLAIQPHAYMSSGSSRGTTNGASATTETQIVFLDPAVAGVLVQVVEKVVAPGFRALCGNLHTSIDTAQPADFALITAILRALLSVKGVEAVHTQIAEAIASTNLVRGALSLYSWSDRLASPDTTSDRSTGHDPIYGELAILFLLALSTVPGVAEQMALDGVLAQLASANLSEYFRKPAGKGPFDEPRRLFPIWTEGFLPLCLNLLDAVGAPVAGDVSTFLSSFRPQLQRAETALENRAPSQRNPYGGAITLGLVREAHSLCLIAKLLGVFVAYAADAGIDANDVPELQFDDKKVREDIVGLARQKTSLASRIVAVGEREEVWQRTEAGGTDNVLLAKVVAEIEGVFSEALVWSKGIA